MQPTNDFPSKTAVSFGTNTWPQSVPAWSCSEPFKCENRGSNHVTQSINEQIGTLPAIEAKFHLFKIGREMLCAESVPCPHDAALEKRERRLDSIGVNVSH